MDDRLSSHGGARDAENLVLDPNCLGIHRSDDLVLIQISWNEGRSVEQQKSYTRPSTMGSRQKPHHQAQGCLHQPCRNQKGELVVL